MAPQLVDNSLAETIREAAANGYGVAFAESLTGGLCAATFVAIPGASAVVRGGVVAYATDLKNRILSVDQALLDEKGPVASAVAMQMAAGVRNLCAGLSDQQASFMVGISTTGVAGPDPDSQTGQLPGVVFIGVSSIRDTYANHFLFSGSRQAIREQTVKAAAQLFKDELQLLINARNAANLSLHDSDSENSQE